MKVGEEHGPARQTRADSSVFRRPHEAAVPGVTKLRYPQFPGRHNCSSLRKHLRNNLLANNVQSGTVSTRD